MDEKGRIVIPRDVRDRLLLKEGDTVALGVQASIVMVSKSQGGTSIQVKDEEGELKHFLSES